MLGLTLRKEFQERRLKGTAIELTNTKQTGAIQIPASNFLEITYPSIDLLQAIEAIGPGQGRPVVILGTRGFGKSHLMAALYHVLTNHEASQNWLQTWAQLLQNPKISELSYRSDIFVISESLHQQNYKFLWDLLLDKHPKGQYIRGKWEALGDRKTDVPPQSLIVELLKHQPTAIILDEFQTWYDGLTNTKQHPWKNWAFNFIQILSEIAQNHPNLLVLVVSVRDGGSDAYQQIHRVGPVLVDFKGPDAVRDRRRLLLHRLFENRLNVNPSAIRGLISPHVTEYFRLKDIPPADQERGWDTFIEMWPFAPHLMQLLEDQVLIATEAQETRDLIRILANLFKHYGEKTPILTAADFGIDDGQSAITALLDSVANQHHAQLREKAQRNLVAVQEAVSNRNEIPNVAELISALWLRSIAVGNQAGATPATLQVDITKNNRIDNNAFQVELSTIVENSFNIHQDGDRLIFRQEENPQAKLMAYARNDRLFTDRSDFHQLAREIRYVLGGSEETAGTHRVIVLPEDWQTQPWSEFEETSHPDRWDEKLPIVVLPVEPDQLNQRLGKWLKEHVQKRRNTIRFLLPHNGTDDFYQDRILIVLSRAVLKAQEWQSSGPEYGRLKQRYQSELRNTLKSRFDRFAILTKWNFTEPSRCTFQIESIKAQGQHIPAAIEKRISEDLFIPEDFEEFVLLAAANNESVGKILRELQEPRPNEQYCIPWRGEIHAKESIIRLCTQGKIAINLRGMEYLQAHPGEDDESAWKRMRGKLGTGKHLDETYILLPQAVPQTQSFDPPRFEQVQASQAVSLFSSRTPPPSTSPAAFQSNSPVPSVFAPKTLSNKSYSVPATSALNLMGKIEEWGISPGTQVHQLSLRIEKLTGAQLQKLLRSLPDGLTYELDLEKEQS